MFAGTSLARWRSMPAVLAALRLRPMCRVCVLALVVLRVWLVVRLAGFVGHCPSVLSFRVPRWAVRSLGVSAPRSVPGVLRPGSWLLGPGPPCRGLRPRRVRSRALAGGAGGGPLARGGPGAGGLGPG